MVSTCVMRDYMGLAAKSRKELNEYGSPILGITLVLEGLQAFIIIFLDVSRTIV